MAWLSSDKKNVQEGRKQFALSLNPVLSALPPKDNSKEILITGQVDVHDGAK